MSNLWLLLLSLLVGSIGSILLFKLKVPGGMIVGGLITVAILNIVWNKAYFPSVFRTITQILAGAYVGCTVSSEDVKRFPRLIKPYLCVILSYLLLNIVTGVIIYLITPHLDLFTSFVCCIPGGMTDIPIIAAEMGADVTKVAALQFVRMALGLSLFPLLISIFIKKTSPQAETAKKEKKTGTLLQILLTLAIAFVFGFLGKKSGIPSGTMLFALLSVLIFKLLGGKAYVPLKLRRVAQILTGVYIGSCFTEQNVRELLEMWPAAILLMVGYSINCILMGHITSRLTSLNRAEAMLVSTPAGASDMALVAADMGITNPEVAVIHVLRLITVVTVFPQLLRLLAQLLGNVLIK